MDFNIERVRQNVLAASTEDLLNRLTVYRNGMEPAAIPIIEAELHVRGITPELIAEYAELHKDALRDSSGLVLLCSECERPALTTERRWHRLWGKIPLFIKKTPVCRIHLRNNE